jgi:hypothetical protein
MSFKFFKFWQDKMKSTSPHNFLTDYNSAVQAMGQIEYDNQKWIDEWKLEDGPNTPKMIHKRLLQRIEELNLGRY